MFGIRHYPERDDLPMSKQIGLVRRIAECASSSDTVVGPFRTDVYLQGKEYIFSVRILQTI